jgi:hypothetical protein
MRARYSAREARALVTTAGTCLDTLQAHPELRARLERQGLPAGALRELRAAQARTGAGLAAARERPRPARRPLLGTARAALGWATDQAQDVRRAAHRLGRLARQAREVAAALPEEPVAALRRSRDLAARLEADELLRRFLTPSGLRDLGDDLVRRMDAAAEPEGMDALSGTAAELAFQLARVRQACLQAFAGDAEALTALGFPPFDRERDSL